MNIEYKNNILKFAKFWLPVIIWALIIFSFSSSKAIKTSPVYWQDFVAKKLAHICEYFIFSLLQYRALVSSGLKKKESGIIAIIFSFLFGVTDEIHQSFTPSREPAIRDVLFDTIGAIFGILFIRSIIPKLPIKIKKLVEKFDLK